MMRGAHRTLALLVAVVSVGALGPVNEAFAQAAPSAERLKIAAEEFDRGRRAYLAKEFDKAAGHFESAYRDAPRAETLRLAIRARREAKQLARAATDAAHAAERYPDDPNTAQLAREVLAEAAPKLADLTIACSVACSVVADGRVVSFADATSHRVWFEPGTHELGIGFSDKSVTRQVELTAGSHPLLRVEPPADEPPPPAAPEPPGQVPEQPPPPKEKPLPPVVFFVAAGVTVALGGATVFSGLDAKSNPGRDAVRDACAGKGESCPLYQDGEAKELRTNVLLGATAGAFVATSVIGLFFTRWSRPVEMQSARVVPMASIGPHGVGAGASLKF